MPFPNALSGRARANCLRRRNVRRRRRLFSNGFAEMSKKTAARTAQANARRVCKSCGHTRPLELFKKSGNGFANICKRCDNVRSCERYWADPDKHRRRHRARRRAHLVQERARVAAANRTPRGRERNNAAVQRWRQRNPLANAARVQAAAAVCRGEIERPHSCEVRGCRRRVGLHAHHQDYERPIDIVFVCRQHHEAVHHRGPLELKPGAGRKWARAPRPDHGHAVNASR
jgi:hypothetical protein